MFGIGHRKRRLRCCGVMALVCMLPALTGCLDSAVFKRFRQGFAPGFAEGFSDAFENPEAFLDGVLRAGGAIFEGLGAAIEPRTSPTSGSSTR